MIPIQPGISGAIVQRLFIKLPFSSQTEELLMDSDICTDSALIPINGLMRREMSHSLSTISRLTKELKTSPTLKLPSCKRLIQTMVLEISSIVSQREASLHGHGTSKLFLKRMLKTISLTSLMLPRLFHKKTTH